MTTSTVTRPKTVKTKHAALYARISEDDGDALGVKRQQADMRKLADRNGWSYTEYTDNDKSASRYAKKRRKSFDAMMRAVDAGTIDVIVCADLSRYTREPRLVEDLIDVTEPGRISLCSLSGGEYDVTTAEGKARLRSEAGFAAQYSDFISDKVKRKKRELIEEGNAPGGTRAFGYQSSDYKATGVRTGMVVEPVEAAAFVRAANDVLAGATLISIARRWNQDGLRTPRLQRPWGVPSVKIVLTNPTHAGLLAVSRYDTVRSPGGRAVQRRSRQREVVREGNWPPLITPEQHYALVALLDSPDRRKRNPPRRSLLTGFVVCGACGGPMRRDPRYYRCHALPDQPGSCGKVIVAAEQLDDEITKRVLNKLRSPSLAKSLRTPKRKPKFEGEDPASILREIDALDKAIGDGHVSIRSSLAIRNALEARLASASVVQADTDDTSILLPFVNADTDEVWANPDFDIDIDRKRAVMRALFDTVTIAPAAGRGYTLDVRRVGKINWRR